MPAPGGSRCWNRPAAALYDEKMKFPRASGILLHPTSLPSRFGIGDFGPEAHRFVDFLGDSGQTIWQVLPLVATGYGESPYQGLSSFAGNPLLISPEVLGERGLLAKEDIASPPAFREDTCEFERVIPYKYELLRRAAANFRGAPDFDRFCHSESWWLDDGAKFLALKHANGGRRWTEWTVLDADPKEILVQKFWQFEFYRQWGEIRSHAGRCKIRILGDIPIYVAHDSADVWSNRDLFELDETGSPLKVAGVPPDYFSATGQLWGNPIYRWDRMEQTSFQWWIERFRATLDIVDMVRVDHFRGFEAYWEVPATEKTAIKGRWVKAPGEKLFTALRNTLGEIPIIAENLGVITEEVEELRHQFSFPGMTILQFAFGSDPKSHTFLPHNYPREVAAYTGTHDNDTIMGWWTSGAGDSTRTPEEVAREHEFAKAYVNANGDAEIHWAFIRAIMSSVADTVVVPMQDVLGLGNEARMNLPAKASGNWRWRLRHDAITAVHRDRLKQFAVLFDRL
jgi:4-alpha-glucanotransferase